MKQLLLLLFIPVALLGQDEMPVVKVNDDVEFKKGIKESKIESVMKKVKKASSGELNVILGDERIQVLDDYVRENPLALTGYRIQLVFGNRNTVNNAKSKFYGNFNGTSLYESYLAPNFRLRVGDFITRLQAEAFLNEVRSVFPSAYIVNDRINVPDYVK